MKLEQINLTFGPFTDFHLKIPHTSNFHLFYGPNEAGKSSLRRGLKAVFYRIPSQTQDDFLHPSSKLRIEATIVTGSGGISRLERRKPARKTSSKANGSAADDAWLADYLGRLDERTFENLFALDHQTLQKGGRSIVSGGAELGQSLFEAGTGMSGLREVLDDLETRAAKLFLPSGSLPAINAAIKRHAEARRRARELGLATEHWQKLNGELQAAREELNNNKAEALRVEGELERLKRIRGCQTRVARRSQIQCELAGSSALPPILQSSHEIREGLHERIERANLLIADSKARISELESHIATLHIDEKLLKYEAGINSLYSELGNYRSAARDIRAREAEKTKSDGTARELWSTLKPGEPLERAEEFRLSREQNSLLATLIKQHQELQNELKVATGLLQDIPQSIEALEQQLKELPQALNTDELENSIQQAESLGDIESRQSELLRKAGKIREEATLKLDALPVWKGDLEEFARLQVPLSETVHRLGNELQKIEQQIASAESEKERLHEEGKEIQAEIQVVTAAGEVSTLEQLSLAREHRDQCWELIRQSLFENKLSSEDAIQKLQAAGPLDVAYEKRVEEADRIADLLRTDSDRVARFSLLQQQFFQNQENASAVLELISSHQSAKNEWEVSWKNAWAGVTGEPLPAQEMSAWLRKRDEILGLLSKLQENEQLLKGIQQQIEGAKLPLLQAMQTISGNPGKPSNTLKAALMQGRRLRDKVLADNQRRGECAKELGSQRRAGEQAGLRIAEAEKALSKWRESWETAVKPLKLSVDNSPETVQQLLQGLDALFKELAEGKTSERRIAGMRSTIADFEHKTTQLVTVATPDLIHAKADVAVEMLVKRLKSSQNDSTTRSVNEKELRILRTKIGRAEADHAEADTKLQELLSNAGCKSVEELIAMEKRFARAQQQQTELENLEQGLLEETGISAEELAAEAAQEDLNTLSYRIAELDAEAKKQDEARLQIARTEGEIATTLKAIDGSEKAASALQEAEEELSQIRSGVVEYAKLTLAAELLRRTVETFRKKNQAPLLERASEIMAKLTLGSISRLEISDDGEGNKIIICVRPDGRETSVDGLSDGTADQLFFALRIAAIENHIRENQPLPVILDDILVNYDNERSAAVLRVLEEVAEKTQVFLFTHHEHLVEIARQVTPTCNVINLSCDSNLAMAAGQYT